MRNLILLFAKYGSTILFVILEFICFFLIINYNQGQREIWLHSANLFSGNVNSQITKVNNYLNLQNENDSLLQENAKLLQTIINYRIFDENKSFKNFDIDLDSLDYELIPANLIEKTIHLRNNFISLNKGTEDGIKPGMGVISRNGIVGIVSNCSRKFSKVLLLLNSQSHISVRIRNKDYTGTLKWIGMDARVLNLDFLPRYAELDIGDIVETSGFSTAFPPGIFVGKVNYFKEQLESNYLRVDVRIEEDFASINSVFVIDYNLAIEKDLIINEEN